MRSINSNADEMQAALERLPGVESVVIHFKNPQEEQVHLIYAEAQGDKQLYRKEFMRLKRSRDSLISTIVEDPEEIHQQQPKLASRRTGARQSNKRLFEDDDMDELDQQQRAEKLLAAAAKQTAEAEAAQEAERLRQRDFDVEVSLDSIKRACGAGQELLAGTKPLTYGSGVAAGGSACTSREMGTDSTAELAGGFDTDGLGSSSGSTAAPPTNRVPNPRYLDTAPLSAWRCPAGAVQKITINVKVLSPFSSTAVSVAVLSGPVGSTSKPSDAEIFQRSRLQIERVPADATLVSAHSRGAPYGLSLHGTQSETAIKQVNLKVELLHCSEYLSEAAGGGDPLRGLYHQLQHIRGQVAQAGQIETHKQAQGGQQQTELGHGQNMRADRQAAGSRRLVEQVFLPAEVLEDVCKQLWLGGCHCEPLLWLPTHLQMEGCIYSAGQLPKGSYCNFTFCIMSPVPALPTFHPMVTSDIKIL